MRLGAVLSPPSVQRAGGRAGTVGKSPCDGTHRHVLRYRDATAPRATALSSRLRSVGACCCDCEMFLNGYQPRSPAKGYFGEDDLDGSAGEPVTAWRVQSICTEG